MRGSLDQQLTKMAEEAPLLSVCPLVERTSQAWSMVWRNMVLQAKEGMHQTNQAGESLLSGQVLPLMQECPQ